MGQTLPQVMAGCQQQPRHSLSRSFPLCALCSPQPIPGSGSRSPLTWPLSQSQHNQVPPSAMGISLPKCQFLGNRAGTRPITTGCQLNANVQAQPGALSCTRHIYVLVLNISMDNQFCAVSTKYSVRAFFLPTIADYLCFWGPWLVLIQRRIKSFPWALSTHTVRGYFFKQFFGLNFKEKKFLYLSIVF